MTASPPSLALVALAAFTALAPHLACGGVRHATRPAAPGSPSASPSSGQARDPTLVEVRTTGYDDPHTIVSFSIWDVAPTDALPTVAPEAVVTAMREEAARRGAELLLLERIEDTFRKLWLGLGVVRLPDADQVMAPAPSCDHPGYAEALLDAQSRAERCIRRLLFERPALAGHVTALFEVDPNGRVLRAAPTPDSSRDGQLQQCVTGAVHASSFGEPATWTCAGRLSVSTSPAPAGTEPR